MKLINNRVPFPSYFYWIMAHHPSKKGIIIALFIELTLFFCIKITPNPLIKCYLFLFFYSSTLFKYSMALLYFIFLSRSFLLGSGILLKSLLCFKSANFTTRAKEFSLTFFK